MLNINIEYNEVWYEYIKDRDNYKDYSFCCEENAHYYGVVLKNIPIKSLYLERDFISNLMIIHSLTPFGVNNLRILNDYLRTYERKQKLLKLNHI